MGDFWCSNIDILIHTDTYRFKLKPSIASLLIEVKWGLKFALKLIVPAFPVWSLSNHPIQQWPVESPCKRLAGREGWGWGEWGGGGPSTSLPVPS